MEGGRDMIGMAIRAVEFVDTVEMTDSGTVLEMTNRVVMKHLLRTCS